MEFILIIVLITSVITNLITVRTLKKFQLLPVEAEPVTIAESKIEWEEELIREVKETLLPIKEEKPISVPVTQSSNEAYKAWKNVVEEPIVASPSPHGPPPKPGPLERPFGFSR